MPDQTPRPATRQTNTDQLTEPGGAQLEARPDRYGRLLRVLLAEHHHASEAQSLLNLIQRIIADAHRRAHPTDSATLAHERAESVLADLLGDAAKAQSTDAPAVEPNTDAPDGNAPAAARLIELVASAYIDAEDGTSHDDIGRRRLRLASERVDRLYHVLYDMALTHLQMEHPAETPQSILLLGANRLRADWINQARNRRRKTTTATLTTTTQGNNR